MRMLITALLLQASVATAHAGDVRNYFAPVLDGHRVAACLSGGACGKPAADAFCKAEGYDQAMLFQRESAASARSLDSDRLCDGNCTAFRQVKCYTVRSDLQTGKTAL